MSTLVVVKSFVDADGRQGHRIYMGPDNEHLAIAGTLFVSPEMWRAFSDTLLAGAKHSGGHIIVVLEGDERNTPRA